MTTYLRDLTLEVVSYYADSCRRTPAAGQWPIAPQIPALGMSLAFLPVQWFAQSSLAAEMPEVEFGARKIFFMHFLMRGPINVLVPFGIIANDCDPRFRRRIAR
jgi:hypothetical protein